MLLRYTAGHPVMIKSLKKKEKKKHGYQVVVWLFFCVCVRACVCGCSGKCLYTCV